MARVIATAVMSLDGYIADQDGGVGAVFDWYGNGDGAIAGGDPQRVFHTSPASAAYMREHWSTMAAGIIGRRLFDLTNGWNGARSRASTSSS